MKTFGIHLMVGATLLLAADNTWAEDTNENDPPIAISLKCPEQNGGILDVQYTNRRIQKTQAKTKVTIKYIGKSATTVSLHIWLHGKANWVDGKPVDLRSETNPNLLRGAKILLAQAQGAVAICSKSAAKQAEYIQANRKAFGLP